MDGRVHHRGSAAAKPSLSAIAVLENWPLFRNRLRQMWTFLREQLRPCLVLWIKFKLCQLLVVSPIKAVSLLLAVAYVPGGRGPGGRGPGGRGAGGRGAGGRLYSSQDLLLL